MKRALRGKMRVWEKGRGAATPPVFPVRLRDGMKLREKAEALASKFPEVTIEAMVESLSSGKPLTLKQAKVMLQILFVNQLERGMLDPRRMVRVRYNHEFRAFHVAGEEYDHGGRPDEPARKKD